MSDRITYRGKNIDKAAVDYFDQVIFNEVRAVSKLKEDDEVLSIKSGEFAVSGKAIKTVGAKKLKKMIKRITLRIGQLEDDEFALSGNDEKDLSAMRVVRKKIGRQLRKRFSTGYRIREGKTYFV